MVRGFAHRISASLHELVERVVPGGTLLSAVPLAIDEVDDAEEATAKGAGYGEPLRLVVRDAQGHQRQLVLHTASSDVFGHDRRADRAAEMLLAFDTFRRIPGQVPALDVGAIRRDGRGLIGLSEAGELYLVTEFAEGRLYADELREIANRGTLEPANVEHCERLARHLAVVHEVKCEDRHRYVRAVRDLIGSGEGLFGIVDGYPRDVPAAPPERLAALERQAACWRWRLRGRENRLSRTHGDYHPFNVVFGDDDGLTLLDAARGCWGDPADDVTAMAINYVFFAVERPDVWRGALGVLWYRFWSTYLEATGDEALLEVAPPFLAWRGLVVANPVWYPAVGAVARDRVLSFLEAALKGDRFDPELAEEVFA